MSDPIRHLSDLERRVSALEDARWGPGPRRSPEEASLSSRYPYSPQDEDELVASLEGHDGPTGTGNTHRLMRIERLLETLLQKESQVMTAIQNQRAAIAALRDEIQADADQHAKEAAENKRTLDKIDEMVAKISNPNASDADIDAATTEITNLTASLKDNVNNAATSTQAVVDKLDSLATPSPTADQANQAASTADPSDPTKIPSTADPASGPVGQTTTTDTSGNAPVEQNAQPGPVVDPNTGAPVIDPVTGNPVIITGDRRRMTTDSTGKLVASKARPKGR